MDRRFKHVLILIALNLVARTLWLLLMHPPQALDFEWYYTHAVQMLDGLGYRTGQQYTAYWPMGYPYFLSLLFHVTGPSVSAGLIANALFSIGIVVLVYLISITLIRSPRIAFLSAIGYSFLPSQIEWNSVLGSEELSTFLLLSSIYAYVATREKSQWWSMIFAGVLLGLSCDIRPIPLLFPFAIWVYELWIRREPLWNATGTTVLVFIGLAIGICPLTIRNIIALHHFTLISTNGGVNLWQGLHADGSYFWTYNTKLNPLIVAGDNQILVDSVGKHVFLQYIVHHPMWAIIHGLFKLFFLYWVDWNVVSVTFQVITKQPIQWLVSLAMWFNTIVYWLWMFVCGIGLWKGIQSPIGSWRVIAFPMAYIIYNTLVFSVFPSWDRFRYPMMPLFAILFGLGLHVILQRTRATQTQRSTVERSVPTTM